MNLYLLEQDENEGYDTYDSMIIAAKSDSDAIHLSRIESMDYSKGKKMNWSGEDTGFKNYFFNNKDKKKRYNCWTKEPDIKLIANATTEPEGIVVSSFNAG